MSNAITAEALGAWLIKCNPAVWNIEEFKADGNRHLTEWSVHRSYRSDLMQAGHPIVLWVTGSAGAQPTPGVWGAGHVTGEVDVVVDLENFEAVANDNGELSTEEVDLDYWVDPGAAAKVQAWAPLDLALLDEPLPRELIKSSADLADMEVLRQPQISNPSWLNRDEWSAMQNLLGEWAVQPPTSDDMARWRSEEEAREPDPVTRALVEKAAVDRVRDELQSSGWQIEDVQRNKVGWDLEALQSGSLRRIEVKGRGTQRASVYLTANEVRAASEEAGWELAVVTSALTRPLLRWFDAATVTAAAEPVTYRATLD